MVESIRSYIGCKENEASFIRIWKSLPSRHVLNNSRINSIGKAKKKTDDGMGTDRDSAATIVGSV